MARDGLNYTLLGDENRKLCKKLLAKANLKQSEAELCNTFSRRRRITVDSLKDHEAKAMANWLAMEADACQQIRGKILSLGYRLGFDKPKTPAERFMDAKDLNVKNTKAFCVGPKSRHKVAFGKMDKQQLSDTVTQLEQILKKNG